MSEQRKLNDNKGFTLVEMIVVLVILAILAAILVPSLLGFVDDAKQKKYVTEAKELMTATQAGIVEAYAKEPQSFENAIRNPAPGFKKVTVKYGYFSNYALAVAKKNSTMTAPVTSDGNDKGTRAKNIISKKVIKYADSVDYKFATDSAEGKDINTLNGEVGFVILFDGRGNILYMQYTRDGVLVTYDGKEFKSASGKNLKIDSVRNP